jgi:hypothetical protein
MHNAHIVLIELSHLKTEKKWINVLRRKKHTVCIMSHMYHVSCTNISYESCYVDVMYVLNIMYSKTSTFFRSVDTVYPA